MRIISIDGGGTLGCGPAEPLKLMEDHGVSHADVLAGTSVGGLLVALRATGRTWAHYPGVAFSTFPLVFG